MKKKRKPKRRNWVAESLRVLCPKVIEDPKKKARRKLCRKPIEEAR
jgi:hypothetical protein